MPAKRKRSLAPGADGKVDEREESPAPVVKKRKKILHYDPVEICQELYDIIRNHKTEDGRLLCETFIRAPKRRTAADYYEVVTTPIDLLKIQQKLKTEEYDDIDQLTSDVELLVTNAKAYYKKDSQEYNDAVELSNLFDTSRNDLLAEAFGLCEGTEDTKNEGKDMEAMDEEDDKLEDKEEEKADADDLEALFGVVVTAREDDRDLSLIFQLLPATSRYPDYYEVIKEPIDLRMIGQKIQNNEYKTLANLEKDLLLMLKNAKTFNTPKSQIYKDSMTLRKLIIAKRHELENKQKVTSKSERLNLRTREKCPIQKMSSICAQLTYPSDDESDIGTVDMNTSQIDYDSEAETTVSDDENPQWALYNTIRNYQTVDGDLSLPFLKLPNKRIYRDYYEEIKRPISLFQIRKKLKQRQYSSLSELASDMNLMFENAKRYNMAQSRLYKDAVILQKAMMERKRELDKFDVKRLERDWDEDSLSGKKNRKSIAGIPGSEKKKRSLEELLQKRLKIVYKTIYDYSDFNGRLLRGIFQVLPSKKDYPDYYQVIMEPVDLSMIEAKIKTEKYITEQALIRDFELMFNNARHYNEEKSLVYQDANTLERVLKAKVRSMGPLTPKSMGKKKNRSFSPLDEKLQELYDTVRNASDKSGRELATPFIKLPLKVEYPDYYEVIKKPVDLQRIQQKLVTHCYDSLEDMVADCVQMFDNACKYNEPDSLIYKDALSLQRVCLEKKLELTAECGDDVPDVKAVIQEIMSNLFISTINSHDEEGRCYSDSFAEAQEERDENKPETERPLTFHQIKGNLTRGRYKRLDRFQEDMFQVFDRARRLSRTDSQLYEDAVEMQMLFMKTRDELCKNGEMVLTPALSFMERHLQLQVEAEKKAKIPLEQKEDEEKKKTQENEEKVDDKLQTDNEVNEEGIKFKDCIYYIGDFVYIEPREHGLEPHIMCIEKFVKDSDNIQMIQGNWFYRPGETYHLQTRKFLEKEVFKSDSITTIVMSQIWGKCYVMFVKDYFKMKPMDMADKDVYVCESRYSNKHRAFKKIKLWSGPKTDHIKIVARDEPLTPVRVESVFADKTNSDIKKPDFDDGETSVLDKTREDIKVEGTSEDSNIYYEQLVTSSGACYKLGDCVYVNGGKDKPMLARIDKLFTNNIGATFFNGPWFVRPEEIQHSPTRLFYKHEVFLSSIEDTNPVQSIIGKCSVLHIKEYCSSRITEITENDVYITESKYLEAERTIKKLGKGLKRYSLSPKVTDDEIYFFRKQILPQKASPDKEPSPLLIKASEDLLADADDSQDGKSDIALSLDENSQTPSEKPKKRQSVKRQPSGYIVYAGEMRKQITHENPEATFGEISRLVGTRWRALPREDKEKYEDRAKVLAAQQAVKQQEADKAFNDTLNRSQSPWSESGHMSPGSGGRPNTPGNFPQQGFTQPQFSAGSFPTGYTPSPAMTPQANFMMPIGAVNMQGMFYGNAHGGISQPYHHMFMPSYPHQTTTSIGLEYIPPSGSSPNGSYSMLPPSPNSNMYQTGCMNGAQGQTLVAAAPPRPPSPMFVSVPPRTQRLLHSEAYLKYIEGLNAESRTIGDWDKQLTCNPDNTPVPNEARLPTQWLSQGAGYHGSVTNALWALRNHMLKDTLSVARALPFEAL